MIDLKSVETQRTVDKLIIKDKESDTPKQSEPLSEVDGEEGAEKDLDTESDTTVETVVESNNQIKNCCDLILMIIFLYARHFERASCLGIRQS